MVTQKVKAEDIIQEKSKEGWHVVFKDENIVTFKRNKKKSFGGIVAFWFFCPFLLTGIAYLITPEAMVLGLGSFGFCWTVAGIWTLIGIFAPAKEEISTVKLNLTSGKICPKCKKIYDDSWDVCINDGTKLEHTKKKQDIVREANSKSDNNEVYRQIEELSKLKEKSILSQEEFDSKKKELLERI
ncbi:MAG: SHOCT domain-containing protein [Candidatus Omnitrophica bacterium]|nr:SHOCT domain-containing protein [Candidatus Omnitrophota bacterium]